MIRLIQYLVFQGFESNQMYNTSASLFFNNANMINIGSNA